MLLTPICLAYLMVVWFKSNMLPEYSALAGLGKWMIFENYSKINAEGDVSFPEYLAMEYNCFFVRLITCPICLVFWLALLPGLLSSLPFLTFSFFGILFFLVVSLVKTFALAGLSLLFYLILVKLY